MFGDPILSCADAGKWEEKLLGGEEEREWEAMNSAGRALGRAVLEDHGEISAFPAKSRILILAGKGHNAGDAIIAAEEILGTHAEAMADVIFVFGERSIRPLVRRCWNRFLEQAKGRVSSFSWNDNTPEELSNCRYAVALDGMLGMNFDPPLREPGLSALRWINDRDKISVGIRAAVDLPSGIGDESDKNAFEADFTYATGIAKAPLFDRKNVQKVGRIRYLDLDFFTGGDAPDVPPHDATIVPRRALIELRRLRPPQADKRDFGHIYLVGGAPTMPGAIIMATRAAVTAGAGLITVLAPASVSHATAPFIPEAMWSPMDVSPGGTFPGSLSRALAEAAEDAAAIVIGPGMAVTEENISLLADAVRHLPTPLVLDAGALQMPMLEAVGKRDPGLGTVVLTPHLGEYRRLVGRNEALPGPEELRDFSSRHHVMTVLKGPLTCIVDAERVAYSPFGGPILARGGSGDLLAGILGVQLGRTTRTGLDPFPAVCLGVAWHGMAAERLARCRGAAAVHTTELLAHLSPVSRDE